MSEIDLVSSKDLFVVFNIVFIEMVSNCLILIESIESFTYQTMIG